MNWLCVTLLICLDFTPEVDYTNNSEFIEVC
jgi:hypothetical protein